ncbi:MAG: hypothetical protein JWM99_1227 [Verrucomicrobiales bacterium]|nr:hypothetical protein [Verrucomicrobiales bacterium]
MKNDRYYLFEVLCVFFWFLLDGCWLMEWRVLTYLFSTLSVTMAVGMFWYLSKEKTAVLVTSADASWLLTNIAWAVGDLEKNAQMILTAKLGFALGFLLCLLAFASSDKCRTIILSRVRILNFFNTTKE